MSEHIQSIFMNELK